MSMPTSPCVNGTCNYTPLSQTDGALPPVAVGCIQGTLRQVAIQFLESTTDPRIVRTIKGKIIDPRAPAPSAMRPCIPSRLLGTENRYFLMTTFSGRSKLDRIPELIKFFTVEVSTVRDCITEYHCHSVPEWSMDRPGRQFIVYLPFSHPDGNTMQRRPGFVQEYFERAVVDVLEAMYSVKRDQYQSLDPATRASFLKDLQEKWNRSPTESELSLNWRAQAEAQLTPIDDLRSATPSLRRVSKWKALADTLQDKGAFSFKKDKQQGHSNKEGAATNN